MGTDDTLIRSTAELPVMAHVPETVKRYVCENCQVTHAGTPIHVSASDHSFEAPETCGACGAETFVALEDWIHHHD